MKFLKCVFVITLFLFLISCTSSNEKTVTHEPYSILIEEFNSDFQTAISSFNTLELDTIYIPSNQVNSVVFGYFSSIFEAKSFAENLILDSVISEYKLISNDSIKTTFNSKMNFVGLHQNLPSIYSYDLHKKNFDLVWGEWGRNVYGLYPDFEKNVSFFITSLSWGRRGGIPYILNARLYYLNHENESIQRKKIFGKGNLINGFWLNDNFMVYFYALDSVKTSVMKRIAYQFDFKGKTIQSDSSDYDLLKGGFPLPPKKNLNYFSPSNKYRILVGSKDSLSTISLYSEIVGDSSAILFSQEELLQLEWSYDDRYSFIRTAKIIIEKEMNNLVSTLIVYDNEIREIVYQINGEGIKNFFIFGDTIVYDDRIEKNSKVYFYNFRNKNLVRTVEHKYGLGLFTYPQVPE